MMFRFSQKVRQAFSLTAFLYTLFLFSNSEITFASPKVVEADVSALHINLIRVKGERIVDAVYDKEALEMTPDAVRGIVFLRVRDEWLRRLKASHPEGPVVPSTAAFINTQSDSYPITLVVREIASQSIEIDSGESTHQKVSGDTRDVNDFTSLQGTREAASLARFRASDYVDEVRRLVKRAYEEDDVRQEGSGAIGAILEESDRGDVMDIVIRAADTQGNDSTRIFWHSFQIREIRAFLTDRFLTEVLIATNFQGAKRAFDLSAALQTIPNVVAIALEPKELGPGQSMRITIIRHRESQETARAGSGKALLSAVALLDGQRQGRAVSHSVGEP